MKAINEAIEGLALFRFGHLGDHCRSSKTTWKFFSHHFRHIIITCCHNNSVQLCFEIRIHTSTYIRIEMIRLSYELMSATLPDLQIKTVLSFLQAHFA